MSLHERVAARFLSTTVAEPSSKNARTKTASDGDVGYGLCPVCGSPGVQRCRCRLGDTKCSNGHEWHFDGDVMHIGPSNHADATDHSTCAVVSWKTAHKTAASPTVNRLTPLAQSVEHDYKTSLATLEQVVRTLTLMRREASQMLPANYHKTWGVPQKPADDINATYDDASTLLAEIEKLKLVPEMKRLVQWVEELASETKARHGE